MRGGQTREALSPLGSAIEADSTNASYRDMRAHVYLRLGITDQAQADAIAAIRIAPTVGAYYNTLGTCALSESKATMAAEAFRQAIRVGGNVPAFHLNLSRALDALGDVAGAERHRQAAGDVRK